MTDNEITREKTFSEELPHFKERIKEVFDNYNNPNGNEDPLYICVFRDSKRIVRKAEEEITRQQTEIERLKDYSSNLIAANTALSNEILEAKAEAYKEFAERLKENAITKFDWNEYIDIEEIDTLLKEMVSKE